MESTDLPNSFIVEATSAGERVILESVLKSVEAVMLECPGVDQGELALLLLRRWVVIALVVFVAFRWGHFLTSINQRSISTSLLDWLDAKEFFENYEVSPLVRELFGGIIVLAAREYLEHHSILHRN